MSKFLEEVEFQLDTHNIEVDEETLELMEELEEATFPMTLCIQDAIRHKLFMAHNLIINE